MVKMHLKRLAAPKSWQISRKSTKFIVRPFPGSHGFEYGTSLATLLTDITKIVSNSSDLRSILRNKSVLVDGVARTHPRFFVGLFDTIDLPLIKKSFRLSISKRGFLEALPISADESKLKVSKIISKTYQKGGSVQLNLHDGTNLVLKDSTHNKGDSLVLQLPGRVPHEHLKMEKDALVFLTGGIHQGVIGKIIEIKGKLLKLSLKEKVVETPKEYAIVVGKNKPSITVVN
ncbi:MAG: hypothetical protein AABX51_05220 [Nanoarchaeota archaeon]